MKFIKQHYFVFATKVLLMGSLLSACGAPKEQKSNGTDEQGNCKFAFITDYNRVVQATMQLEKTYDETPASENKINEAQKQLSAACSIVKSQYKGTTCLAKPVKEEKVITVTYEELRPNCETLQRQIKDNKLSNKPITEKPITFDKVVKGLIELVKEEAF
jgi:hypothetical protein